MLWIQNVQYHAHKLRTKLSQSRSMWVKPRPTEIVANFSWIKSHQYFAADVSLFLGYSSAIRPEEGKHGKEIYTSALDSDRELFKLGSASKPK